MNIWILTIGSSDVQLKTKKNWATLFRNVRSQLDDRGFNPSEGIEGKFQVPARVMGVVYSKVQAEQHFEDLVFPLINNFINKIQEESIRIDQIVLVLSDQSIFTKTDRSSQNHPYWQDTCTLRSLLEKYLREQLQGNSPDLQFQDPPLLLKAKSANEGLDDWNAVLKLVQEEFSTLNFPDDTTIYVSHQAGTPAISSAVQFTSLSCFGQQVRFLVSNERDSNLTKILPSSEYLKGIRKKETKALLSSYNYAGVKALVEDYLDSNKKTETLLNAAIQWNVAKFDSFLQELTEFSEFASDVEERIRAENWWWIAYEEVYLAIIRKQQGNIVEAFFHSFRAFEGIFAAWGHSKFNKHIKTINGVPYLRDSILDDSEIALSTLSRKSKEAIKGIIEKLQNLKDKNQKREVEIKKDDRVEMNLRTLCNLLKAFRYADYNQNCKELKIFWDNDKQNNVSDKRNFIVHQVQGMSEEDLQKFWGVESQEELESRLRKFLNFIIKEDFPGGFNSLKEASLMVKVHQALEEAIASL